MEALAAKGIKAPVVPEITELHSELSAAKDRSNVLIVAHALIESA